MLRLLEYVYYRINRFFFKFEKMNGTAAPSVLAGFGSFLTLDILVAWSKFTDFDLLSFVRSYLRLIEWGMVTLIFLMTFLNVRYFRHRLPELRRRWDHDKRVDPYYAAKGWLIFLLMITPFFLLGKMLS